MDIRYAVNFQQIGTIDGREGEAQRKSEAVFVPCRYGVKTLVEAFDKMLALRSRVDEFLNEEGIEHIERIYCENDDCSYGVGIIVDLERCTYRIFIESDCLYIEEG